MRVIDNINKNYQVSIIGNKVILKKEQVSKGVKYIEFVFDEWEAEVNEPGYYVVADTDHKGSSLCYFTEKENQEYIMRQNLMPITGVKTKKGTYLVIVDGMKFVFYLRVGLKNKKYYIAVRFSLDGEVPYEDISFYKIELDKNATYSDMAVYYRNHQLQRKACVPLKERAKDNPYLSYAMDSVEIRIRMGWKPAPAEVLEQTVENEPEMKIACTFERVKDFIKELKVQGIDKAEICLVGWNKSGHDGRYPQLFPVEERLGGEKGLRDLIQYAQHNGYQIVCHTNSTDSYRIADSWDEDIVIKKKDGSLAINETSWSGGTMYHLCPVKALEYAEKDLPKVADLGFRGIHYIDVMTVVPLRRCHDKNHPVTEADTKMIYERIGDKCHELFGGYASEGAFDYASQYLDYALYIMFKSNDNSFFDEEVPLWALVYHGIILNNPSTETVNYTIKSKDRRLKLMEYGGRPTFYVYSKFMTEKGHQNWLGIEDLEIGTNENMKYTVEKIVEAYNEYKKYRHLQMEFINSHCLIDDGVYELQYSNGIKLWGDYNKNHVLMKEM